MSGEKSDKSEDSALSTVGRSVFLWAVIGELLTCLGSLTLTVDVSSGEVRDFLGVLCDLSGFCDDVKGFCVDVDSF